MSLNPYATPFIPQPQESQDPLQTLLTYPFFQQKLEKFLFTNYRSLSCESQGRLGDQTLRVGNNVATRKSDRLTDVRVENLQILMVNPPIKPQTKATTVFLGQYNNISLLYEADRLEDPRTGKFVKVN